MEATIKRSSKKRRTTKPTSIILENDSKRSKQKRERTLLNRYTFPLKKEADFPIEAAMSTQDILLYLEATNFELEPSNKSLSFIHDNILFDDYYIYLDKDFYYQDVIYSLDVELVKDLEPFKYAMNILNSICGIFDGTEYIHGYWECYDDLEESEVESIKKIQECLTYEENSKEKLQNLIKGKDDEISNWYREVINASAIRIDCFESSIEQESSINSLLFILSTEERIDEDIRMINDIAQNGINPLFFGKKISKENKEIIDSSHGKHELEIVENLFMNSPFNRYKNNE